MKKAKYTNKNTIFEYHKHFNIFSKNNNLLHIITNILQILKSGLFPESVI